MSETAEEKSKTPEPKGDSANWSHDIESREYYYDDATGYEIYEPEEDDDDDSKEDDNSGN